MILAIDELNLNVGDGITCERTGFHTAHNTLFDCRNELTGNCTTDDLIEKAAEINSHP